MTNRLDSYVIATVANVFNRAASCEVRKMKNQ